MTEMRRRPIELADSPEHRAIPIESFDVEENSDNTLILKGYASTFQPYEMYGGPSNGYGWIEQIDRAAFERTLKEGPDLHLLINHEGLPLARTKSGTLDLSVDDHGLHVVARLDRSDPDVQRLEPKMRRKDMDEMSFAFRVKGQKWESTPEFPEDPEAYRTITEVSLHKGDVSVVNFGANPTTHAELHSVGRALAVLADCDPSELVEARANRDVLLRAKAKLANVGVLNAQGVDASLPAAEVKGVNGPTGTVHDGLISNIPLVGPLIESILGLSDANKSESRADADDDVSSLIAALDAALDEACSLTADVDRETLSEPVAQALDLMRGADTIVDKLMEVSGVYDPDDADRASDDESEKREDDAEAETSEDAPDERSGMVIDVIPRIAGIEGLGAVTSLVDSLARALADATGSNVVINGSTFFGTPAIEVTEERDDEEPEETRDEEEMGDETPQGLTLREALALQGIVPSDGVLSLAEAKALSA